MSDVKVKRRLAPSLQIILGFLGLVLLGTLLLSLPISNNSGQWLGFIDSFFTSTSAVCVTGLVVVDTATQFTLFGQFVIIILIQIGGLGIVAITSFIFLLLRKKIHLSNRIALQESLNRDTIQGVVKFIKKVLIITILIECVGAVLLLYPLITYFHSFWKGVFASVFMSISMFCNAGFDVFGNEQMQFMSVSPFASNVLVLLSIMMLVVFGGIGFGVLIDGFKDFKRNQHAKIVVFMSVGLIFFGAGLFMVAEWNNPLTIGNMSTLDKIINSFFQSVSTRTAGCASFDQAGLSTLGTIGTMLLMFIGGSPTSTAGGIKTTTLFILIVLLFKSPNQNGNIVYKGKKISANIINKAVKIVLYSISLILVAVIAISIIEGKSFSTEEIIFECISAISTVGLSMGVTPYLSYFSKIIIAILMFIGRVGMTTITLALSTRVHSVNDQVEYINSDIIVG